MFRSQQSRFHEGYGPQIWVGEEKGRPGESRAGTDGGRRSCFGPTECVPGQQPPSAVFQFGRIENNADGDSQATCRTNDHSIRHNDVWGTRVGK